MANSRTRVLGSKTLAGLFLFSVCFGPKSFVVADNNVVAAKAEEAVTHDYSGGDNTNGYVSSAGAAGGGRYELCLGTDISSFLPPPYGNLSGISCTPLWNTFVLRYLQREDNVMTIILSAIYATGWVGIGFSRDGRMIGSSAMVGWVTKKGHARIKQYYLQGTHSSEVVPDHGELQLEKVPPAVVLHGAMIYMAFQVRFESRLGNQPIILAFSSTYPSRSEHLHLHDDKTTVLIDFSKASASVVDMASLQKRNHGILGIFSWGLILPLGAIIARHLRHKDPLWYYLHAIIQFVGFILGLSCVLLGLQLYEKIKANIPAHRRIGILLLVLSILQVLAFFLRPSKDSKNRRYWNWYHHWVGRMALFFGALNIILGMTYAKAGLDWRVGYGFLLTVILVAVIVLEVLLRMRRSEEETPSSTFQMNPIQ